MPGSSQPSDSPAAAFKMAASSTVEPVPTTILAPTPGYPTGQCKDLMLYEWNSPGTYDYVRHYNSEDTSVSIFRFSPSSYEDGNWDESYVSAIPCEIPVGGSFDLVNDVVPIPGVFITEGFGCTHEGNILQYNEITAYVTGWESIITPLGTFNALRIDGDNLFHLDHTAYSWQESSWWVCGFGLVRQEVRSDLTDFNLIYELTDYSPEIAE